MGERDLAGLLGEHAARHSVPGAAIAVLRDGAVTTACHGVADSGTAEQVTAPTKFAVGSLTKSMVATVIARLVAAGQCSLDDAAALHVPELHDAGWAQQATLRDLLANRSRLPLSDQTEFSFGTFEQDEQPLSRLVATVASGQQTPPIWSYSNAGWCVLGRAIETLTEMPWEEAMAAHLFNPAEMLDTTFVTSADAEPHVAGHELGPDGPAPVEPWLSRAYAPAGTTVLSTATDLLRFARLHLEDPVLAGLRRPHANVRIGSWLDAWCLGWARFDWYGGPIWGWDGLLSGQRSILRLLPEQGGAIVLMTNCGTGRALYRSLFGELLEPLFGVRMPAPQLEPVPGAAGELSRFAGVYAWPDQRWEVTASDSGLILQGVDRTLEALPLDDRSFLVDVDDPDSPTVTFGSFDADGRAGVLYQVLWGLPRVPSS